MRVGRKVIIVTILSICSPVLVLCGRYGEHKRIGDEAFAKALTSLKLEEKSLIDSFLYDPLGGRHNGSLARSISDQNETVSITYGILTALSGDYAESPLQLFDELGTDLSRMRQIVLLQHRFMKDYYFEAPEVQLATRDISFVLMAIEDESHFYDYDKGFIEQVDQFDLHLLRDLFKLKNTDEFSKKLYHVNSINKYITLHTYAICIADSAASLLSRGKTTESQAMLRLAIFVNAYGDHFLQDMFSAGHRVVHRSRLGSFTNNKVLHDFFGQRGLKSVNLRGQQWTSYGDSYINKRAGHSYDLLNRENSFNLDVAISCDSASIAELFMSFFTYKRRYDQGTYEGEGGSIINELENLNKREIFLGSVVQYVGLVNLEETIDRDAKFGFFLSRFKALELIPIPFNTEKDDLQNALENARKKSAETIANDKLLKPEIEGAVAKEEIKRFTKQQITIRQNIVERTNESINRVNDFKLDPEMSKPLPFLKYLKAHKGQGISVLYGSYGTGLKDLSFKSSVFGLSFNIKGIWDNFEYNNETLEFGTTSFWLDLSLSQNWYYFSQTSWGELKLGVNYIYDLFSSKLEFAFLNEFGWQRKDDVHFIWVPSIEARIFPHSWGLKGRVSFHERFNKNGFPGFGFQEISGAIVYDCTSLLESIF